MNLIKGVAKVLHAGRYKRLVKRVDQMELRLNNLEMALDAVIEHPTWKDIPNIGFNWQHHRKNIFKELMESCSFDAIIETGTWIGHTTGYMAKYSKLPIHTCEIDRRFYNIANMRLKDFNNISFYLQDSRQFLKYLGKTELADKKVFIYLDSHWYDDLPLVEELITILDTWSDFVVMIDDFKVPNDAGYGYDICFDRTPLSLELIQSVLLKMN